MPNNIHNIDKIKLNNNTYVINDSIAQEDLNSLNSDFEEFKDDANNVLNSFDSFRSYVETFINDFTCSIEHVNDNEYALVLNLH